MRIHKSKLIAVALCLVMLLSLCPLHALAAPIDTSAKCTLNVKFTPEGIKASGVEFRVYKVASVTDNCTFVTDDTFKNQSVLDRLENAEASDYSIIASTLSGVISADTSIKPDAVAVTNSEGVAVFKNLDTGLYLISGDNYITGDVYYAPSTYLVCVPESIVGGVWNYDVTSEVKWLKGKNTDTVDIKVLKVWSDSDTELHTDDKVTVNIYKNGELYDTQVLCKDNNWTYTWSDLQCAATWTVNEAEVEGYKGSVERKGNCFVITNEPNEGDDNPGGDLPNTGLTWWPVPLLLACGCLFILIGLYARRKSRNNENS